MTSVVDNLVILTQQENAITEQELRSEALNGRYYSYERHKWQSMGWVEWLVRKFFVYFLDSVQTTCLRHSWKAIEKMPNIPIDIKNHIEDLFLDSLYHTNPRSSYSGVISRIFCRTHCENARINGLTINQIDIQQHSTDRSFGIFYNKELRYLVANSEYGRLDVYNPQNVKVSINDYDSLWNADGDRIGAIRLAVDYSRQHSCMKLYSGKDLLLAKIEENKEKISLVFREATTNRLLAVSNLVRSGSLINWTITLIDQDSLDQKKITPILLAWAILKYSQHYHFSNPDELKYVQNLPQVQIFHD